MGTGTPMSISSISFEFARVRNAMEMHACNRVQIPWEGNGSFPGTLRIAGIAPRIVVLATGLKKVSALVRTVRI